ncbi:MAG: hypothetical protein OEW64_10170 [Gammaproteobacteria bacterium]|nr:hypothetical protein [Gammaproteobacteria bacterium]MDH5304448.1 hypothetical protein [Gammaproteobacteria bacterium]MDH5323653.1 hypothetical protein [Gammaproteobacteria bacterium]
MAAKTEFVLNWRQAVVDVFLIVIGVSIALAADSWLGDRVEQARTDQLLDALEDEWTAELDRIDVSLEKLSRAATNTIRIIYFRAEDLKDLSDKEVEALWNASFSSTFKPSNGALSTLMVDGVQNIEDRDLRLAIASWRTVLAELDAEQAAVRELGTLTIRNVEARIARNSGAAILENATAYDYYLSYGIGTASFLRAAIADDEWLVLQSQLVSLLYDYRQQLVSVREILKSNLDLLRARAKH